MKTLDLGGFSVGDGSLTVIAGPCMAESRDLCREVSLHMKDLCLQLGVNFVFKASFDKANRTSVNSMRGGGLDDGLGILESVKTELNVPVTTDIHLPDQARPVSQIVDLLQVPAFLCRQTDLLHACADTGKPVNVKKGQFLSPSDTNNIVVKMASFGAQGVMLTERGTTFGYNMLVVDMPGLETMRSFGVPVCFDATHSAQRPGGAGTHTAGARETIPAMARAAAAVGIDALFLEVHPDPANALSDAATQWPLHRAEELLRQVLQVRYPV